MIPQEILFPSIGTCATANLIFCDIFHQTHRHLRVSLGQYLEFWGKLLYPTLYTSYGLCFVLVPHSSMCYASEMGGNWVTYHFDFVRTNTLKLIVSSFEAHFVHIGLCDAARNFIFIGWNMCFSQFNILSCVPTDIWARSQMHQMHPPTKYLMWTSLMACSYREFCNTIVL